MWPQYVIIAWLLLNYVGGLYRSVHSFKSLSAIAVDHAILLGLAFTLWAGGFWQPLGL